MEKRELPNSTLILVFGILSIIGCCCYGIAGIVFGIIALVMSKRAIEIYNADPELYTGYQNVKTGRILAIIGLVLSGLSVLGTIVSLILYGGFEGIQEMQQEILREYGG
jgi:hypothetical protein